MHCSHYFFFTQLYQLQVSLRKRSSKSRLIATSDIYIRNYSELESKQDIACIYVFICSLLREDKIKKDTWQVESKTLT